MGCGCKNDDDCGCCCIRICCRKPPPPGVCETAYAKGWPEDKATCFTELGFGNWGWTNGPISPGYQGTWEVWAGAGQCDTSKGTLAGLLEVHYVDDELRLNFDAGTDGCCIRSQQIYVGSAETPTKPNGDPTVAPGQYPFKQDFADCVRQSSFSVQVQGDVYVIFHAEACCPEGDKKK